MLDTIKNEFFGKVIAVFSVLLTFWWITIYIGGTKTAPVNYLFGGVYGSLALLGAISGLLNAHKWGGMKSIVGKAIIAFSCGLLLQAFGQYVFWYYNFFAKIEVPYPSLADVGYFGSIPFYIYGSLLLGKASGIHFSLRKLSGQLQAILIPIVMLTITYLLFLHKYSVDLSHPLKSFLDYGYPLGQAIYISIAVLTYSLSRKMLGGVMRKAIFIVLLALGLQYLADFSFLLFQDQYYNGSIIDYIYLLAYLFMGIGLLSFKTIVSKLRT